MATPFIGEIRMFGFVRTPQGWQACDGSLLSISDYEVLFMLIGTTYGGDGQNTFAVPDLRGRVPLHQGQGPGLSSRQLGNSFGTAAVSLLPTQIPPHQHGVSAFTQPDSTKKSGTPANGAALSALGGSTARPFVTVTQPDTQFSPAALLPTGNGLAHQNQQPYLAVNFCIALSGTYPQFD